MWEERYSQILFQILKTKHPNWTDEEINRKASQIGELGFFLVRQWLKQHSKHVETTLDQENED